MWRIIRTLDRLQDSGDVLHQRPLRGTHPDSVRQIVKSGHDVGGHNYTQDALLAYMEPDEERATIRACLDLLGTRPASGRPAGSARSSPSPSTRSTSWRRKSSPGTPTSTYTDLPIRLDTRHGPIGAVPNSDFTDNRVLRSSPRDLWDVYKGTFDYLQRTEPMSLLVLTLHCHFGGRPMITSVFEEVVRYLQQHPDVWFARHEELGRWALAQKDEHSYQHRFF